ncbi:MAG: glycoside hydrolase family 127 protein, partial [Planctomycetes bacterium]|nr:glycoside hydrolase family 127 protein [Planctomycetota bacterium]
MIRPRSSIATVVLGVVALASTAFADDLVRLTEVPFTRVTIEDRLFAPRRDVNRRVSLAHSLDMLEKAGNLRNLERAARGERTGYEGPVFMDSDLYKVVEAVAYSLATDPDPALDQRLDAVTATIAAAQRPDGYLNSWYQVNAPERRFTNLRDDHELYCAGHLFEAAAAHFRATGKRSLLDVATKYADLLCATFGAGDGKRPGYCGHPEIELALIKLADVTGETKYVDLARHFIDTRGSKFFAVEH